jgi:hypothetical protein
MRDIKTEQNLATDEYWPTMPIVLVPGDAQAQAMADGATQEQGEQAVQSWQRVAVLKVVPAAAVYWGFMSGTHSQFMNVPVELDGSGAFGVRVGDGEVSFYIIPVDLQTRLKLELVEITDISNPHYQNLPLY